MKLPPVNVCILVSLSAAIASPVYSDCLTASQIKQANYGRDCAFESCMPMHADTGTTHEANCSYARIQATTHDSFQATDLTHQTAKFELDLSVDANETLVFGLIGYQFVYTKEMSYCKVFTACPQQAADSRQQRIQLRLRLSNEDITHKLTDRLLYSYALYATKTTNGKLCDQPQMRLFLPLRESDKQLSGATSLQLGIRDAASCITSPGGCTLDPYLRRDTAVGATRLELKFSASKTTIWFNSTRPGWKRSESATNRVKFYSQTEPSKHELKQRIDEEDADAPLRWRIHTTESYSVDRLASISRHPDCPVATAMPSLAPAPVQTSTSNSKLLVAGSVSLSAIAILALLVSLLSCRIRDSRRPVVLLLVASDDLATDKTVARLRQALTGHRAFKRDRLRLRDLPGGVSNLTADLARKSAALIFVSRGADFADLRLDGCLTDRARAAIETVLGTEKCRAGVCYVSSGATPPTADVESPWAGLDAVDIGAGDLEAAAEILIAKLRLGGDSLA